MRKLDGDVLIGVALVLFGLTAAVMSLSIGGRSVGGENSRLFPLGISLSIVAFGGLLIWSRRAKTVSPIDFGDEVFDVLKLIALGLLYVLALQRIGYIFSTALVAPFIFWVFGVRSKLALASSFILCPLIFHLVFFAGLGVFPPFANWFSLRDLLNGI